MLVTTPAVGEREYRQVEDIYFRSQVRRDVRILLVGERGVGKTSVILSLVSEEFTDSVPAKSEEITIPADVTPELVPTNIVDYSGESVVIITACKVTHTLVLKILCTIFLWTAQEQSETELTEEILKAHVICIVYAVNDDDTIDRISTYWLPIIRQTLGESHKVPIILIGNKIDLVDYTTMEVSSMFKHWFYGL